MTAILITYDQAHHEKIIDLLDRLTCRGYTSWPLVHGRGTSTGDPHLGTHAWPSESAAIITVVPDERVQSVLDGLRAFDADRPLLGLRAFAWPITASI